MSKRGQPGDPSQSNQKEAASGGKRKKNVRVPPPRLNSLEVTWEPNKNEAKGFSFHLRVEAKLDRVAGVSILQNICDGISIKGGTNPGNLMYYMTEFADDLKGSTQSSSTKTVLYDDTPGYYDADYGIEADTDLKYVFGARWTVMWRDKVLAATTSLFGIISGTGPTRTCTPAASVTAVWNRGTGTWTNQGTLAGAFPNWGAYPVPPVDNAPHRKNQTDQTDQIQNTRDRNQEETLTCRKRSTSRRKLDVTGKLFSKGKEDISAIFLHQCEELCRTG